MLMVGLKISFLNRTCTTMPSQGYPQRVRDQVIDIEPAVGEEVLQHFGAGREEKSQEEPQPERLPHGSHKEAQGIKMSAWAI